MRASLRHGQWTPVAKSTVRFAVRPPPLSLASRIEAAELTAIRAREAAGQLGETTEAGRRMIAQAESWEQRADEWTRLRRGKQTITILLPCAPPPPSRSPASDAS